MSHGTGQDLLTSGLLSALGFSHLPENDLGLLTISELIPLIAAVIGSIALTITIIKAIYHFKLAHIYPLCSFSCGVRVLY